MDPKSIRNLIVIGGGPAALTAAIYAGRASLQPLVFAGNMPGGQLMLTSEVENFPGFGEPILGPELMERWRTQAARYGAELVDEDVTSVDFSTRPFRVTVGSSSSEASGEGGGQTHEARSIIVATGASAKWLGIPNEQRLVGKGVHTCAQCDGFAYTGKHVAVVGGGDTAMEETTTLAKIAAKVTVIHRRSELRASKIMAQRVRENPKVTLIWDTVVEDVLSSAPSTAAPQTNDPVLYETAVAYNTDRVTGIRLRNLKTDAVSELATDALFVAIGYTPATAFLKGQLELNEKGYIVVHDHTRTNIDGVFAAGDVEDFRYRQAVTAAGAGCAAAIDAERWLAEQPL